jgi:hypothetical protein
VAATCLPAITGTTIMSALAWCQQSNVPEYPWLQTFFSVTWIPGWFGAVYGPILIPLGAAALLSAGRRTKRGITWAWLWVVGGVLGTAVWYGWALKAVELP